MIHQIIVPNTQTVNLTFTVPTNYIGEEMEVIAFIKKETLTQNTSITTLSPALQGNPLTNDEFKNWILQAENQPTLSLQDAKVKWKNKRQQLQQIIK
ncbi:MAG: hypothetical protein H7331_05930 [Bacteroidia bacterium]|nr:hypothetical protein [Bacteroidia bacterium]